ncbi:MAG: 2-hydroxymuconate tautomerase family protein [bacterium]|nr:2-hydroxymuconate tautomerase family protein [bacterium]
MPILTIHMLEGRTKEKKRELIEKVTDLVVEVLDTPPEAVRIVISEMKNEEYGVAGLPVNEYRVKRIKGD